MALDPWLLEVLACPSDKGPLLYLEDEEILYNPRMRLLYRIDDGIPVMLIEKAETVDDDEHRRLTAEASTAADMPSGTNTAESSSTNTAEPSSTDTADSSSADAPSC